MCKATCAPCKGKGRYIKRPAFSDNFAANKLRADTLAPTAVKR